MKTLGKTLVKVVSVLMMTALIASAAVACRGKDPDPGPDAVTAQPGDGGSAATDAPAPTDGGAADTPAPTETPTGAPTEAPADPTPTAEPTDAPAKDDAGSDTPVAIKPYEAHPGYVSHANDITDVSLVFDGEGGWSFSAEGMLFNNDLTLTISAPADAKVYYTLDGRMPDESSTEYTEPLKFEAHGGDFPPAYVFRAAAKLADGTFSKTAAKTFIVAKNLEGRFTTLIFSISGDPDDLTERPDGIFYGRNYSKRGRESERGVFVEAVRADGTELLAQYAGVRIYGGYSRQNTIKSMKLFSRKSYDPDHKNFKFSEFGTAKLDGSDGIIKKYDKLVLRNSGNDMQFAFIRDELSQALCRVAGFEVYEGCLPAVAYLNGEYYGYFWLHENYCDKYLKELYGDAEGEFFILEGSEQDKSDDEDCQWLVDEYNTKYDAFVNSDLTDDAEYAKLCDFMDVEDYLDYYAWNITINNWDWPNNNYKVFRYVEADAAALSAEGAVATPDREVFDGRWRFLVHDMDYAYGIYDQFQAAANYNNLKVILNPSDNRYSPLFKKLMERKDCRNYFRAKTMEFLNGAFSEESILATYKTLDAERADELAHYYDFLDEQRKTGDFTLWTSAGYYAGVEKQIFNFAKDRQRYVIKFMDSLLPEIE